MLKSILFVVAAIVLTTNKPDTEGEDAGEVRTVESAVDSFNSENGVGGPELSKPDEGELSKGELVAAVMGYTGPGRGRRGSREAEVFQRVKSAFENDRLEPDMKLQLTRRVFANAHLTRVYHVDLIVLAGDGTVLLSIPVRKKFYSTELANPLKVGPTATKAD